MGEISKTSDSPEDSDEHRATILALALLAQPPALRGRPAARAAGHARSKDLLEVYTAEAAGYTIYRDASRKEKLELQARAGLRLEQPVRDGDRTGRSIVWTDRGRAEVIGTFFSFPRRLDGGRRDLCHEFHSLSLSVLDVSRSPQANRWTPRAPGIHSRRSPAPRRRPARPRNDSRRCTPWPANSRPGPATTRGGSWELRLLPQPLYRYESTDPEVLDGAVFAFVTSAGTDPEVILVLEARKPAGGGEPAWQYAAARFTDLDLWVSHKEKVVFTAT